jgi:hypothetical protein
MDMTSTEKENIYPCRHRNNSNPFLKKFEEYMFFYPSAKTNSQRVDVKGQETKIYDASQGVLVKGRQLKRPQIAVEGFQLPRPYIGSHVWRILFTEFVIGFNKFS